jgi:hypothetical protein
MRISTILDHIDNGHMTLPEFQRGYAWNREQLRSVFASFCKLHSVRDLLAWVKESHANTRQHLSAT